jgi:hypothetical protein
LNLIKTYPPCDAPSYNACNSSYNSRDSCKAALSLISRLGAAGLTGGHEGGEIT